MSDVKPKAKVCKGEAGSWEVVVDRGRCEGKLACVEVCPHDLFELGRLSAEEHRGLPLLARLKARVHGLKTIRTPRIDACHACGLCVLACPEEALKLVPAGTR